MNADSIRAENNYENSRKFWLLFPHCFKGLLPHFRENSELCGKGLIIKQDVK